MIDEDPLRTGCIFNGILLTALNGSQKPNLSKFCFIIPINLSLILNSFPDLSVKPKGKLGCNFFSFAIFWYTGAGSNCRHLVPQTSALTN